jgi:HD superfamily phosphohydrolase
MTKTIAVDFPELGAHPSGGIWIPPSMRVPVSARVKRLIDMPLLQRLRQVRQLSFAHFVYPGAMHTRFEHTLGVYTRTLQYLAVLLSPGQGRLTTMATTKDIAAVIVASLLHDAGHYPMAHSFEEILPTRVDDDEAAQRHDVLLARALEGKVPSLLSNTQLERLTKLLKEDWHGIVPKDVAAVIRGHRVLAETISRELVPVLQSILDGPLDTDKLDYLQRDSLHTGNPAGGGIDEARLVDSLVVEEPEYGLGIKERGLSAAQTLLHARFSLFLTVYWHRSNRTRVRMFTEAASILRDSNKERFADLITNRVFGVDDEGALEVLATSLPDPIRAALVTPLRQCSQSRGSAFVEVLEVSASADSPSPEVLHSLPDELHSRICYLFEESLGTTADRWKTFNENVRDGCLKLAGGGDPYEVLVDVPDPRYELPVKRDAQDLAGSFRNRFMVYTKRAPKGELVDSRAPLFGDLLENWRKNARKVRVFASPRISETLSRRPQSIADIVESAAKNAG